MLFEHCLLQSFQVQFFAATTLHTKLMKYWNEVPENHYEYLKKRILEAIISYAMGPKIVLNRLCIAVSFCSHVYYLMKFKIFSCQLILSTPYRLTGQMPLKNWYPAFSHIIYPALNRKGSYGFYWKF